MKKILGRSLKIGVLGVLAACMVLAMSATAMAEMFDNASAQLDQIQVAEMTAAMANPMKDDGGAANEAIFMSPRDTEVTTTAMTPNLSDGQVLSLFMQDDEANFAEMTANPGQTEVGANSAVDNGDGILKGPVAFIHVIHQPVDNDDSDGNEIRA